MKVVFAGTPEFAVPTLQGLLASPQHQVLAVYTQPDRPAGRGQKLLPSPVKELALAHKIAVFQPANLRDAAKIAQLQQLQPDVMVVVAYGLILPKTVLTIPRFGCLNVHGSLLPRWRGAAPIERAILAGDTMTGISIMQMDEGLDTGAVYARVNCSIEKTDTSGILRERLSQLGCDALLKVLSQLDSAQAEPQNSSAACYAKKIDKSEAALNWSLSAIELDRMIRAFNPRPIAYTTLQDQVLRIWEACVLEEKVRQAPGSIIRATKQGIDIACGDGVLRLLKIQLPGGRCLPVADILNAKSKLFEAGQILK